MLPYIGTIEPSLHLPLNLPDKHFIIKYPQGTSFPFLNISLIFIENKCLSDLICGGKREKNEFSRKWIQTRVDHIKKIIPRALHPTPLSLLNNERLL